jgi:UDP-N-acetylmuramyl pentapeptide phosphotransferase/UDP-N-acetylglucosamine-1-phosphate transferase
MITYIVILALLFVLELCYFKIAVWFNIVDKPNQRSSHARIVLRGGGIIFTIALWVWSIWSGFPYPWMLAGVTLAAGISFVDDIHSLPNLPRLISQILAVAMVLVDVGLDMPEGWLLAPFAWLVCVSVVNFYNFMDGINGITGGYSVAVLLPLLYLNQSLYFVAEGYLEVCLIAVLVFCFFNFRTKAKCFAGDVGAVSIALILLFAVWRLIVATGDITYLMFFAVYAADAMLTIAHRIMLKENLGEAHRKHAYQLMANELKIPHVVVSCIYMVAQLIISFALFLTEWHWVVFVGAALILIAVYLIFMKKYYHLHEEYLASIKKQ